MSSTVSRSAAVPPGSAAADGATTHSSSSAAAQGDDVNLLGKVAGAAAAAGANTQAAGAAALARMDAAVAAATRKRGEKRGAPETDDIAREKIPTRETATDDQIRTAATRFVSPVHIVPWDMLNSCELGTVDRIMDDLRISYARRSTVSQIVAAVFADARAAKRAAESEFE